MINEQRFMRQLEIFNPLIYKYPVTIVGAGGIGSALGICLAKLGICEAIVWDADIIEEHNMSNQLFSSGNSGSRKAEVLISQMRYYFNQMQVISINKKLDKNCVIATPIVFSCTDSIESRETIYKVALESECRLLIDGRMAGKVFRIFTVNLLDKEARERYEKTFFKEKIEQSCTERAVIFNIFGIASMMTNQLVKVFLDKSYPFEINFCYENYILRTS